MVVMQDTNTILRKHDVLTVYIFFFLFNLQFAIKAMLLCSVFSYKVWKIKINVAWHMFMPN